MFGLRCVTRCVWFKLVSLNPPLRHHNQVCKILHCISQSIIMYSRTSMARTHLEP